MSNALTYEDFLNKLQTILSLLVRALKKNSYLVLLIGDFHKKGVYTCIARDIKDLENTKFIQEIIKISIKLSQT